MDSALIDAARAFHRAQDTLERRRAQLANAIVEAATGGMRQADIIRISGYSREHIRRILRDAADREAGPGQPF